jgi:hypothetical protein
VRIVEEVIGTAAAGQVGAHGDRGSAAAMSVGTDGTEQNGRVGGGPGLGQPGQIVVALALGIGDRVAVL